MQDAKASTEPDEVLEIMQVGRLLKTAVNLVHGLEIKQDKHAFHLSVVSILRFLKV